MSTMWRGGLAGRIRVMACNMTILLFAVVLQGVLLAEVDGVNRPNIVILYADDMGYGDISSQNEQGRIQTPHLDRLAREGMRFTDGHSSSGICTPSRYALLTGRYHWRKFHGIVGDFGESAFDSDRLTLPEMLQSKGYNTACIGKWHLGWDWEPLRTAPRAADGKPSNHFTAFDWSRAIPDGPLDHGFDHYFGDTVINFPPYAWIEDDRLVTAPDTMMDTGKWKKIKEGNWECRPGPMVTGWDPYQVFPELTRRSVDFIRSRKGDEEPFFLYFPFPCPHAPIIPNDEFDGTSEAGPYGDFIVQTDDTVGQVLKALKDNGFEDNTLVIFSADNGPERYAYARDENFGHWSAEPFRGLKRDIYEGGHHVPFLVKWPGVVRAGSESDALVSQIDIMATVASIVGGELDRNTAEDSFNMLPVLQGQSDHLRNVHVHNTYKDKYALRFGDWILIESKNGYTSGGYQKWEKKRSYPADDNNSRELYHFASDPGQRKNLIEVYPEIADEISRRLSQIRKSDRSAPWKQAIN